MEVAKRIEQNWVKNKNIGEKLPAERGLVTELGVSRTTIRSALKYLDEKGLVFRCKSGVVVQGQTHMCRTLWKGKNLGVYFGPNSEPLRDVTLLRAIRGMYNLLTERKTGLSLLLGCAGPRFDSTENTIEPFAGPDTLGLFLIGQAAKEQIEPLKALGKPLVAVDWDASAFELDSVVFDNLDAGRIMAQRLARLGHKNVVVIFESPQRPDNRQDPAWAARRKGFLANWAQTGRPAVSEIWLERRGAWQAAFRQLQIALSQPAAERPTAAVFASDDMAAEALLLIEARGLAIPQALTLMTFASEVESRERVTAVRFFNSEMGRIATQLLLRRMMEKKRTTKKMKILTVAARYVAAQTHGNVGCNPLQPTSAETSAK
jgi:DNA-binding LacI/PurR family transcriptional regulator